MKNTWRTLLTGSLAVLMMMTSATGALANRGDIVDGWGETNTINETNIENLAKEFITLKYDGRKENFNGRNPQSASTLFADDSIDVTLNDAFLYFISKGQESISNYSVDVHEVQTEKETDGTIRVKTTTEVKYNYVGADFETSEYQFDEFVLNENGDGSYSILKHKETSDVFDFVQELTQASGRKTLSETTSVIDD